MNNGLELFLLKIQDVFGTPEDTLTGAANYFPAIVGSKFSVTPDFTPLDIVSAGYDQDASVRGMVGATGNLSCYMRSLGLSIPPDFSLLARISGFKETTPEDDGADPGKYVYTLNGSNIYEDATCWHFTGGAGTSGSLLKKFGNIIGDWKISGDTGKVSKFELTGAKGTFLSEAVDSLLVPTKDRTLYPAVLPITVLINGQVYNILKFSFDGNTGISQYTDCSLDYGFAQGEITKKKAAFSFTAYADVTKTLPLSTVIAGIPVEDIQITYGLSERKIQHIAQYPQFTKCEETEAGDLTCWDVSGILTRNDYVITVNSDYVET